MRTPSLAVSNRRRKRLSRLCRIKDGKMVTNDLFCAVTFNALRPGVPSRNPTLRIEHANGVVLRGFDKQPKPFFTFRESPFSLPSFRDIAKYKHDTGDLSPLIPNWRRAVVNGSLRAIFCDQQSVI